VRVTSGQTTVDHRPGQRSDQPWLLAWSAPDEQAERQLRERIRQELDQPDPNGLAGLAGWLTDRHDPDHPVRAALVAADPAEAARALSEQPPPVRRLGERAPRPVALLLDGHGAQQVRMAAQLYGHDPVFTSTMDDFLARLGEDGVRLRTEWLSVEPGASVDAAECGQPLLFAVGYALGRLVLAWGVRPTALIGHSVGELAAAALAGVVTPADVALLMAVRAEAYPDAAPGGLLAVAASPAELVDFVDDEVTIAVVNGPTQTMLAGPEPALDAVAQRLLATGRTCLPTRIPLPFHSPALIPLAHASEMALAGVPLRAPSMDIYSTRTAARLTAGQARDARFWAEQVCTPVLFAPALDALLGEQDVLLVEAGPSRALTNLARQHPAVAARRSAVVAMLPARPGGPHADRRAVLDAAKAIWLEGHDLAWSAVQGHSTELLDPFPPNG
jgi:acyl transferase domain-containing protein